MSAVPALLFGHEYQGRLFLFFAAQLRMPDGNIERVGLEDPQFRSFDDVVVRYRKPVLDRSFGQVDVDAFQVKFTMRQGDEVGWEQLQDPAFINAPSHSILERLRGAVQKAREDGIRSRFTLYSPRPIAADLRQCVLNADSTLDLAAIFEPTKQKRAAAVLREALRAHLEIDDDSELREILAPLRIMIGTDSDRLREEASLRLQLAGMAAWSATQGASQYDNLPAKLVQARIRQFDRAEFERVASNEGLILGDPLTFADVPLRAAICSFGPDISFPDVEPELVCRVDDAFSGRWLRDGSSWDADVIPRTREFVTASLAPQRAVLLHLATHLSIAFTAGKLIGTKQPVEVSVVQGGKVWHVPRSRVAGGPATTVSRSELSSGADVAVALAVTHDILADVCSFVKSSVPDVGVVAAIVPTEGVGQLVVRDGAHAFSIAEEVIAHARALQRKRGGGSTVHLFAAAPGALVFFLGRLSGVLGRTALYEFDFARERGGSYHRSVVI